MADNFLSEFREIVFPDFRESSYTVKIDSEDEMIYWHCKQITTILMIKEYTIKCMLICSSLMILNCSNKVD